MCFKCDEVRANDFGSKRALDIIPDPDADFDLFNNATEDTENGNETVE